MGSVLVNSGDKITKILGKNINLPIYLQFVPGQVIHVCTAPDSLRTGEDNKRNINTIIAKPHVYDTPPPKNSNPSSVKLRFASFGIIPSFWILSKPTFGIVSVAFVSVNS